MKTFSIDGHFRFSSLSLCHWETKTVKANGKIQFRFIFSKVTYIWNANWDSIYRDFFLFCIQLLNQECRRQVVIGQWTIFYPLFRPLMSLMSCKEKIIKNESISVAEIEIETIFTGFANYKYFNTLYCIRKISYCTDKSIEHTVFSTNVI